MIDGFLQGDLDNFDSVEKVVPKTDDQRAVRDFVKADFKKSHVMKAMMMLQEMLLYLKKVQIEDQNKQVEKTLILVAAVLVVVLILVHLREMS